MAHLITYNFFIKGFLLIIGLGCSSLTFSQDLRFSQFYANRLYLNPGFAGSEYSPSLMFQHRNQWPGYDGAYVSYAVSYDDYSEMLSGGVGFMAISDNMAGGALNRTSFHMQYSRHFRISRTLYVQTGLEAALVQRKMDPSGLIFPGMINRVTGEISNVTPVTTIHASHFSDFSAGAIAYFKEYFFGFAVHHILVPDESFPGGNKSSLDRKYTLHAGTSVPLSSGRPVDGLLSKGEIKFSPNIMYQQQGSSKQVNLGMYLSYQWLEAGLWMNNNLEYDFLSFIFSMGYVHTKFRIAYSYDIYAGVDFKAVTGRGAHEFSLFIPFSARQEPSGRRCTACPRF